MSLGLKVLISIELDTGACQGFLDAVDKWLADLTFLSDDGDCRYVGQIRRSHTKSIESPIVLLVGIV